MVKAKCKPKRCIEYIQFGLTACDECPLYDHHIDTNGQIQLDMATPAEAMVLDHHARYLKNNRLPWPGDNDD